MGKMEASGAAGETGGEWGIVGNCQRYTAKMYKKCVKLVSNGRKIGEKWDNLGQIPHFSQSRFLAIFPSSSFDGFCQRNQPTGTMGIVGFALHWPIVRIGPLVVGRAGAAGVPLRLKHLSNLHGGGGGGGGLRGSGRGQARGAVGGRVWGPGPTAWVREGGLACVCVCGRAAGICACGRTGPQSVPGTPP